MYTDGFTVQLLEWAVYRVWKAACLNVGGEESMCTEEFTVWLKSAVLWFVSAYERLSVSIRGLNVHRRVYSVLVGVSCVKSVKGCLSQWWRWGVNVHRRVYSAVGVSCVKSMSAYERLPVSMLVVAVQCAERNQNDGIWYPWYCPFRGILKGSEGVSKFWINSPGNVADIQYALTIFFPQENGFRKYCEYITVRF
jgi:hypothetical protein